MTDKKTPNLRLINGDLLPEVSPDDFIRMFIAMVDKRLREIPFEAIRTVTVVVTDTNGRHWHIAVGEPMHVDPPTEH